MWKWGLAIKTVGNQGKWTWESRASKCIQMQPSAGILGRLEGVVGKHFTWCTVPHNNYLRTKICTIHCDQWQKRWTSLYTGMVAVQWKVMIPTNLYIGVSCQFFGKAWSLVNPMNSPLISGKSLGFVFWNEVILSHQVKNNWSQGGVINYHDQLSWRCDKLSTSGCCYPWLPHPFPAQLCRAPLTNFQTDSRAHGIATHGHPQTDFLGRRSQLLFISAQVARAITCVRVSCSYLLTARWWSLDFNKGDPPPLPPLSHSSCPPLRPSSYAIASSSASLSSLRASTWITEGHGEPSKESWAPDAAGHGPEQRPESRMPEEFENIC